MYAVVFSAMLMSGLSWLSASFAQPDSRHVDSNMTRNLFMISFFCFGFLTANICRKSLTAKNIVSCSWVGCKRLMDRVLHYMRAGSRPVRIFGKSLIISAMYSTGVKVCVGL